MDTQFVFRISKFAQNGSIGPLATCRHRWRFSANGNPIFWLTLKITKFYRQVEFNERNNFHTWVEVQFDRETPPITLEPPETLGLSVLDSTPKQFRRPNQYLSFVLGVDGSLLVVVFDGICFRNGRSPPRNHGSTEGFHNEMGQNTLVFGWNWRMDQLGSRWGSTWHRSHCQRWPVSEDIAGSGWRVEEGSNSFFFSSVISLLPPLLNGQFPTTFLFSSFHFRCPSLSFLFFSFQHSHTCGTFHCSRKSGAF